MYTYYVSFVFFTNGAPTFRTGTLTFDTEITTLADVQQIEASFRSNGFTDAAILGFSLLPTRAAA
jgi:hypothetical protein